MKDFRINAEIPFADEDKVRVIGDRNIVISFAEAKKIAQEEEVDIIDLGKKGDYPLIQLMSYNKFLYKLKKENKPQKTPTVKEIRITAQIGEHDLQHKAKQIIEFLEKKMKVKITLTLKGREMANKENNKKKLLTLLVMLEDYAKIESMKDENNKTIVILTFKK